MMLLTLIVLAPAAHLSVIVATKIFEHRAVGAKTFGHDQRGPAMDALP